jgi:acyl carrier protein
MLTSDKASVQNDCIDRVIDLIARIKKLPLEQVTIESEFVALNIDSIDAVEILFELENEFSIEIPDEQMYTVRTVRQAAEAVDQLLKANASDVAAS